MFEKFGWSAQLIGWSYTNEEVRKRAGIERELASRADQRVLRLLGHMERMDKYRIARKLLKSEIGGGRI